MPCDPEAQDRHSVFHRSMAVATARESVDALVTRVVLLDYPLAVRQALGRRLSLEADVSIVGEADDAAQALTPPGQLAARGGPG